MSSKMTTIGFRNSLHSSLGSLRGSVGSLYKLADAGSRDESSLQPLFSSLSTDPEGDVQEELQPCLGLDVGFTGVTSISGSIEAADINLSPPRRFGSGGAIHPCDVSEGQGGWQEPSTSRTNKAPMKIWPQIMVALTTALAHLALGGVISYTAIALPELKSKNLAPPQVLVEELYTKPSPSIDFVTIDYTEEVVEKENQEVDPGVTEVTVIQGSLEGSSAMPPMEDSFMLARALHWPNDTVDDTYGTGLMTYPPDQEMNAFNESARIFEAMALSNNISFVSMNPLEEGTYLPDITLTDLEVAIIGGIHTGGAVIGCLVCGTLMSMVGQRRAILIAAPITFLTWFAVALAPMASLLIIARLIAGVCIGVLGTSAHMYIMEIAHESIRGALVGLADLFVGLGVLLTYGLGASSLGWRWSAAVLGVVTCIPVSLGLMFFPDSPRWLAAKGRTEDAKESLQFLRGKFHDVTPELEQILKAASARDIGVCQKIGLLRKPSIRKPFLIVCGVFFFNQLSGNYVIYSYSTMIFQAAKTSFSPTMSSVLVGVARLLGSITGLFVVENLGRRPALFIGGIGVAVSFGSLGVFFHMQATDISSVAQLGWLPLTCLFSFTFIFAATTSPIPFLLSGELQPLSFRSVGSAGSKIVFFLTNLAVTFSYPYMALFVGDAVTFWLYSVASIGLVILVWIAVPETKGKSLEQIEAFFQN